MTIEDMEPSDWVWMLYFCFSGIGFRMFRNLNMWVGTTEKFLFGAPLPIYTKIKLKISPNTYLNLKGRYNRPGSYGDRKPDWGVTLFL